jgi:hypothetical protein
LAAVATQAGAFQRVEHSIGRERGVGMFRHGQP